MGYISQIEGRITFEPPLNNKELLELDYFPAEIFGLEIHEEYVTLDEGDLTKRSSGAIIIQRGEGKLYNIVEELKTLASLLVGRQFDGEFIIYGEANKDIRKLFIEDYETVTEWKIQLTWPDGTPFSVV
jgi:hypothetical protein